MLERLRRRRAARFLRRRRRHDRRPRLPGPDRGGQGSLAHWIDGWRGPWEEANGDRVAAFGGWQTRGVASGSGGFMPWGILYTLRDGLVVRHEWFLEPERARSALAA